MLFHPLERIAMAHIQARAVQELVARGMSEKDATQAASHAASGGLGSFMQWILANLPSIYAFAEVVLLFFGIVLPPLPPIPVPAP